MRVSSLRSWNAIASAEEGISKTAAELLFGKLGSKTVYQPTRNLEAAHTENTRERFGSSIESCGETRRWLHWSGLQFSPRALESARDSAASPFALVRTRGAGKLVLCAGCHDIKFEHTSRSKTSNLPVCESEFHEQLR